MEGSRLEMCDLVYFRDEREWRTTALLWTMQGSCPGQYRQFHLSVEFEESLNPFHDWLAESKKEAILGTRVGRETTHSMCLGGGEGVLELHWG